MLGVGLHTFLRDDEAIGLLEWREWRSEPTNRAGSGTEPEARTPPWPRIASQEGLRPSILDRLDRPRVGGDELASGLQRRADDRRGPRAISRICSIRTGRPSDIPEEFAEVRSVRSSPTVCPTCPRTTVRRAELRGGSARRSRRRSPCSSPGSRDVRAVPLERDAARVAEAGLRDPGDARLDPSPEVAFVTVLKLTTGEARSSGRAGEHEPRLCITITSAS